MQILEKYQNTRLVAKIVILFSELKSTSDLGLGIINIDISLWQNRIEITL